MIGDAARCFGGPLDGQWFEFTKIPVVFHEIPVEYLDDATTTTAPDVPPQIYVLQKYGFVDPRDGSRWAFACWIVAGDAAMLDAIVGVMRFVSWIALSAAGWRRVVA